MKSQKLKIKSFLVLLSCCFIVSLLAVETVRAQMDIGEWFMGEEKCVEWTPVVDEPGQYDCTKKEYGGGIRSLYPDFTSFGTFVSSVLPNVYVIAGVILLFLLIFGGFTYIVNAGNQDTEGIQKGKKAITNALIGFLLIFGSWWIIQIVEIVTGIDILK